MNKLDLHASVSNYEVVLKACGPLYRTGNSVARAMCELFVVKSASLIRACLETLDQKYTEGFGSLARTENHTGARCSLPSHVVVHSAAQKMFAAVAAEDAAGIFGALEEMGVLAFCPTAGQQFTRLEHIVGRVIGRARLIPLIELAIFAVDLDDYNRASTYAAEARSFDPGASELHDLCAVEGAVALNAGNVSEAIELLAKSIYVCQADDFSCLTCRGRALNIMLADRLLKYGEREEVVKFLVQCQKVWKRHGNELMTWIGAIQNGEEPRFLASGFLGAMNHPSLKILELSIRASFLEAERSATTSTSTKSIADMKERLRAEFKRQVTSAIKGRLGTSNN